MNTAVRILSDTWVLTQDSAANTSQTLTRAAELNHRHYLTRLECGISAAAAGASGVTVTVVDGATTIYKTFVPAAAVIGATKDINFSPAIRGSYNSTLSVTATAAGTSSVTTVNMVGYTLAG